VGDKLSFAVIGFKGSARWPRNIRGSKRERRESVLQEKTEIVFSLIGAIMESARPFSDPTKGIHMHEKEPLDEEGILLRERYKTFEEEKGG